MRLFSLLWEMRNPNQFLYSNIKKPLRSFLKKMSDSYRQKTTDGVTSLREILFKAGVIALTTSVVVWVSVFLYVAFYYSYMPNVAHSRPVHLQFKSCDEQQGICSFPSSHVQLTKRQQLLMVGQPYRIKLSLDMPESEANKGLGMFLSCAELRAHGGTLVAASCRSGLLPYRSQLLSLMTTLVYAPLFVVGLKEERRNVEIELFSHFEEDMNTPVTDVYVEIQSRHIQLYSATLFIEAHFSGLRYLMFHWPMLSAVVGISTNLLFVAFVCVLSWYHLKSGEDEEEYEDRQTSEDNKNDLFSIGTAPFLFDPDDLQDPIVMKEEKQDDDSHTSDISSLEESLLAEEKIVPVQTKRGLESESTA